MNKITIPVKCYTEMQSPYKGAQMPYKVRFYSDLRAVPAELADWMSTNPREQNLTSPVAKAIAASIREATENFHMKNRGVLLSAKTAEFTPAADGATEGQVTLTFEDPALHGNVDGGHTLRLILAAQRDAELPEQYVEFEVLVGVEDLIPIAEARNTSVALDMRTMEEMKGSFDVLKSILGETEIGGDRFFERVELKMNQQLEEANHIDIRTLIGILLMFNQELYPNAEVQAATASYKCHPSQMYGSKEEPLKRYLALGGGDPAARDAAIRKMAPIMKDVLSLWDAIERELPLVKEKQYQKLPFAQKRKNPVGMFSNTPIKYSVPQSIVFPHLAAFRALVQVDADGNYSWGADPFAVWEASKSSMFSSLMDSMKTLRNNPGSFAKKPIFWQMPYMVVQTYKLRNELGQ